MLYVILGLSLFFGLTGFVLTENNAKYILSGYNMMSEEERAKFDLKNYILYFRKFHLYLGISVLIVGVLGFYFIKEQTAGVLLTIYIIITYIFFILTSNKYAKEGNINTTSQKIGIFILIVTLLFIIVLFFLGKK